MHRRPIAMQHAAAKVLITCLAIHATAAAPLAEAAASNVSQPAL